MEEIKSFLSLSQTRKNPMSNVFINQTLVTTEDRQYKSHTKPKNEWEKWAMDGKKLCTQNMHSENKMHFATQCHSKRIQNEGNEHE